jgi:hypothetical protein
MIWQRSESFWKEKVTVNLAKLLLQFRVPIRAQDMNAAAGYRLISWCPAVEVLAKDHLVR